MTTEFVVGDMAVYPSQGVAEVVSIDTKEIMGISQTFYVLRVLDSDKKIFVPVQKVDDVGLRQVISTGGVEEIYGILRERDVDLNTQTWNRRSRAYLEKIQTGSPYETAEVLRDLSLLKSYKMSMGQVLSFGEKKMLENATRLLVQELAIAKDATTDDVTTELETIFS